MGVIAKQSIKGASANYLGVLIGAITTFFVVTDLLTQEEIGLTRVMVDAAMLFAGLAQLGTNASIVRFYPRFRTADRPELRDHGFFGWILMLPLLGFTVIATLFFIFKNQIVAYYSQEAPLLTNYVSLLLPLTFFVLYMTVFETNASVLLHIAVPKFVREVVIRVLNLIAYLLYGHMVISLDLFVILFCSSYAVATLVNFLYLLSLGRISFRPDWHFMNHNLLREVGVYTLFMTATVLAGNIKLFNSIFIAKTSLAAAGIYTIACYIANVVEIPYRSLGAISSPIISQAVTDNDIGEVNRLGKQVSLHQLLVASMLLFFIWINLTPLFRIIPNGQEYTSGMGVVLFLGIANILNSTLTLRLLTPLHLHAHSVGHRTQPLAYTAMGCNRVGLCHIAGLHHILHPAAQPTMGQDGNLALQPQTTVGRPIHACHLRMQCTMGMAYYPALSEARHGHCHSTNRSPYTHPNICRSHLLCHPQDAHKPRSGQNTAATEIQEGIRVGVSVDVLTIG